MGDDNAAPSFGDIGGKSDELFNSGFNYGFYGLTCSTKTRKDQEFSAELKKEIETNEITGNISSTLINSKEHGLVVKQSWSTENTLTTDASIEDPLNMEGFTFGVENTYQPNSKEQSTMVRSSYVTDCLNIEANYDVSAKTVNLSSVLALEGYLAGVQLDYDVSNKKLGDYTLTMGVDNEDITGHAAVTNLNQINASMYRKINRDLETGAFVSYSREGGNEFGMATKYIPHEDTVFTGKVNNSAEVGLSFQQVVTPGVTLTLSSLIQSKNFHAGGHKVGVGLELNP